MALLKFFILLIVVIGLLGFAALSFGFSVLDSDFAQIAARSDEYTTTPEEFKARSDAYLRKATIAFLVAISLPVISVVINKRENKS